MPSTTSELPVHILVASLATGGAERLVCETVTALQQHGVLGNLFVLWKTGSCYQINDTPHFRFFPPEGSSREQVLQLLARRILDSPVNLVLTHLIPARDLELLWRGGVRNVPVIHNTRQGWHNEPAEFEHPNVPFVIAASDAVARELRDAGLSKQIVVVRHELQRWYTPAEIASNRAAIRARYRISDHEYLVGMVGNFKAQKAYPRAIRVLDQLRRFAPARLLIVGAWDHSYGYGRVTYEATLRLVRDLGLEQDLILAGGVADARAYYAAFDVFLNTSIHEGLSIAMLEAQQVGCPVVTANAGGNIESLMPGSQVVHDPSDIQAYLEALIRVRGRRGMPPRKPAYPTLIPHLWRLLGTYSTPDASGGILFVTNSLNKGGATRSLLNLLTSFPNKESIRLCVLGAVHNPACLAALDKAAVQIIRFESPANVIACAERLLSTMHQLHPRALCFWNVDASVKLLVTKVLSAARTKLIDVSPGPLFFDELDNAADFQNRIAFNSTNYFARLDWFIAKYRNGVPPPVYNIPAHKVAIIPNGVPCPPKPSVTIAPPFEETLRTIACCRLVPEKRVEFLIDSVAEVSRQLPEASLTLVGGPERSDTAYAQSLARYAESRALRNIWFTGPQACVDPFLNAARVFVTASAVEGCSNAVLEAMAAGLPVVATATPGIAEQVEDGVTGFILPADGREGMPQKVVTLLTDPEMACAFGNAGRERVQQRFGIDRMVKDYLNVLAS